MPTIISTLAAASGTIGTAALLGAGTAAALTQKPSKKEDTPGLKPQPIPPVPKPEDSTTKAKSELARRKKIIALAGGKTILTTETPLGGSGVKTLLGA